MITFKVEPDEGFGEAFSVTATSRDIARWEKVTKSATFQSLMESMSLVHLYRIAYFACKRQGLWDGTEADFEANCDVTPEGKADSPDPT